MQYPALIYLACQLAGQATDPASLQTLVNNARCIECGIPPGMWMPVLVNLACVIAGGSGGGPQPPTPPVTCSDADGQAFLNAAGITDATTVNAVCNLVISLKSAGVWTQMDAIYPFVGGSSASTALNLKNPATLKITWHGGPSFSAAGVTGNGTNAYGDTGYNPSTAGGHYTLNSASLSAYIKNWNTDCGVLGSNDLSTTAQLQGSGAVMSVVGLNVSGFATADQVSFESGFYLANRSTNLECDLYCPSGLQTNNNSGPTTSMPNANFFVLARNSNGTAQSFSSGIISFAAIGPSFSGTAATAIQTAVNTFETALSRN